MTASDPSPDESVFHAARELTDAGQRAAFLEFACGGDRAQRARIEALFAAAAQAERFFGAGPQDPAFSGRRAAPLQPPVEPPPFSSLPAVTGFKILQRIQEAGDATVYLAEQASPLRRRVALKVLRNAPGDDPGPNQCDALACGLQRLDHPNIAKVLTAGTTASGQRYIASELVRGIPITDYCDAHELAPAARAELFGQLCAAIEHAHHHQIFHGDLKPSDALVTIVDGVPVVKVTGFNCVFPGDRVDPAPTDAGGAPFDPAGDITALGRLLDQVCWTHAPEGRAPLEHPVKAFLGHDPSRRPRTVAELAQVARGRLDSETAARPRIGWWQHWSERVRHRPLRTAAVLAFVGLLAAVIVLLGG